MREFFLSFGKDYIQVKVDPKTQTGTIESTLKHDPGVEHDSLEYDSAIDGLEAVVLAHACLGINIEDDTYKTGIAHAIDAIANPQVRSEHVNRS